MKRRAAVPVLGALLIAGCASMVEVPVETPLQSKLDVSRFRRILIAGFVTEPESPDVDLSAETSRLLQNQLRSNTRLQVLEPDHPPLADALAKAQEKLGDAGQATTRRRRSSSGSSPRACCRTPSTGARWVRSTSSRWWSRASSASRARTARASSPRSASSARPATGGPALVRGNRYMERKGYSLSADFYFIDTKTGELLHKERFTEEVLYSEDQRISPLSSYFELMDRLLPNFLGVITPQRIRGTRVLLGRRVPTRCAGFRSPLAAVLLAPSSCCRRPAAPVHPLLREEQGQVRQLRLARLQEPALRDLLLPRVRAAPGAAELVPREQLPQDLDRPQARDAGADPGHLLQDPLGVRADEPVPGLRAGGRRGLHRAGEEPHGDPDRRAARPAAGADHPRDDARLRLRPDPARHRLRDRSSARSRCGSTRGSPTTSAACGTRST